MSNSVASALQTLLDSVRGCIKFPGATEDELRPLRQLHEKACSLSLAAGLKAPPDLEEAGLGVIELIHHYGSPDIPPGHRTVRHASLPAWERWQDRLEGLISAASAIEGSVGESRTVAAMTAGLSHFLPEEKIDIPSLISSKKGPGKDIDGRMERYVQHHEKYVWIKITAEEWAAMFRCSEGTVKGTKTWRRIMEERRMLRTSSVMVPGTPTSSAAEVLRQDELARLAAEQSADDASDNVEPENRQCVGGVPYQGCGGGRRKLKSKRKW
jgi:hypothetical protein